MLRSTAIATDDDAGFLDSLEVGVSRFLVGAEDVHLCDLSFHALLYPPEPVPDGAGGSRFVLGVRRTKIWGDVNKPLTILWRSRRASRLESPVYSNASFHTATGRSISI